MEDILGLYLKQKNIVDIVSGKPLSKERRIESMYSIVQNIIYGKSYNNEERVMASKLITKILEEE